MVFFRLCERWTHADFKSTQPATQAEDYWQTILQDQPYLISLIFPGPVAVHTGKAYLGGKKVDNTGGKIVDFLDFLLEHSIGGNAALLEIKRPPEGGSAHIKHASAAMTLDVYADLFESDLDDVAVTVSKMCPRWAQANERSTPKML